MTERNHASSSTAAQRTAAYAEAYAAAQPDPGRQVVTVDLEAREFDWEFAPGSPTRAWGFNRTVPGPTLEATVGDVLEVRLTNRLPEPTVIHWHGLRIPAAMDGTEMVQHPVAPGETLHLPVPPARRGHLLVPLALQRDRAAGAGAVRRAHRARARRAGVRCRSGAGAGRRRAGEERPDQAARLVDRVARRARRQHPPGERQAGTRDPNGGGADRALAHRERCQRALCASSRWAAGLSGSSAPTAA